MNNQQLTLLDIPSSTPSSQWDYENEDTCDHELVPGNDKHGLFCWRCQKCWESMPSDPIKDHNQIVKAAQGLKRNFQEYYLRYELSKTEKDKKRFLTAATDRYWKARLNFLRVGIDRPLSLGDFEQVNPCPPDLQSICEILTQKSPLNMWGRIGEDVQANKTDICTRGKSSDPQGTLEEITPSKKSRREVGHGTGHLFCKPIKRGDKSYPQWWFQYEEKVANGKRVKRTVYVANKYLDRVQRLNQEKRPIHEILGVLPVKSKG